MLVVGEELRRCRRALGVELDGEERRLGRERREDPGRADARSRCRSRRRARARAGPREPGAAGRPRRCTSARSRSARRARALAGRAAGARCQRLDAPCPDRSRCRPTGHPSGSARSGASTTRPASRTPRAGGRSTRSPPAATDRFRIALVVVDVQNTFCTPGFELFVGGRSGTGALDDSRRLCEFVYRNLGAITQVFPTLDTHQALQIFHRVLLARRAGPPSRAVHAGLGRGRGLGPLADQPGRGRRARPRRELRRGAPPLLHPDARGRRQVRPHDLAVPCAARRDRPRARLGGRGGDLLPHDRALRARRLPAEGRQPAHRALLDARPRGGGGSRRRAARAPKPAADRGAPPLRRGRDRGPGEEPLRRLDDPGLARGPDGARPAPGGEGLPPRGLHLARRRPGRRRPHRRRRCRVRAVRGARARTSSARRSR